MSSLPLRNISKRSDEDVRQFFDRYYTKSINLTDNDLNSVVGFFQSKGFDQGAALTVGTTIISQSKLDNVPVFQVLDTLRGYDALALSAVVAEILNYNRRRTSAVGFKRIRNDNKFERRNIIDGTPPVPVINIATLLNLSSTSTSLDNTAITLDGE